MKILVVEDDYELGDELAEILRDAGYAVDVTADSQHGARLIEQGVYDCCLLDYKMPGLNGIDLLQRIKTRNPATAAFIVSGRPGIEDLLLAESAIGLVAGIIKKPFAIETILAAVRPRQ